MGQHMFSSEAAKVLGIGTSTLRSYSAALEARGYLFTRGKKNGRLYCDEDIKVLTKMIQFIVQEQMTIKKAAEHILSIDVSNESSASFQQLSEQLSRLEDQQEKLTEVHMTLTKQVERLTEKIEERERDLQLFQRLENTKLKKKRKGIAIFGQLSQLAGKKK